MAAFARVLSGTVAEILATGGGPAPQCVPALGQWIDISNLSPQPAVGWSYDGTRFAAPAPDLSDAQATAMAAAQAHFDGLIAAGFTYQGKLYQIDSASQAKITAMGALAQSIIVETPGAPAWPAGFGWIAADNSLVPMTAPEMFAFAATVAGFVAAATLNLRTIKTAIAAAGSIADVEAIDVAAGYPVPSA